MIQTDNLFQNGFRFFNSTVDILTDIVVTVGQAVDENDEARVVALDISTAFDRLSHTGLLLNLNAYGISGGIF